MLNRELGRAMTMAIPPDLAAALVEEQRRHLAGQLGESREAVEQRRRLVCYVLFREYLEDIHSFVGRPNG